MNTARRSPRRSEAQLAFEALSIEGALLAPEWLARVSQVAAEGQGEADYRVPKGLNLRDEIGRYWRVAQAHWHDFSAGRAAKGDARALSERFVLALLREAFGFGSLVAADPFALGAGGTPPATPPAPAFPIGFSALAGRVPVVIAPAGSGLDALSPTFGDGTRRRSAFGLAQEYLNAQDGALWGLATDGVTLRILRDNASLTRPAWIEADLARIFTEERYADFAALWLLAHETRFGRTDQPAGECALEAWRTAGREQGTRAREHLRRGVEDAVLALGQGFVAHPHNGALRAALEAGDLTKEAYFQQLLRLVYRLIFLITVEERDLLHPPSATDAVRRLYAEGYSLRRLRERAVRRSAHDRHGDVWEGVKIVLRGLTGGEARLGLPALAGIFAVEQTPALDAAKLENRALLTAMFKLCWLKESTGLARVNWRDMGPEELGSVYESLLELVPVVSLATRTFGFASGGETKGNARKTTGSYYTPDSLVQVLLDSALEPVVRDTIAASPANPARALLKLAIVDPACGSGHFLLAAARRVAAHVARLEANGTPSAAEYRRALRKVVGSCIYGVDLNPMAVELCKVALWMEAVEPGLPLTFLDAHIRHGNALLGATPELIANGIPDDAWNPIEGDDKVVAKALKKRHKSGQASLFSAGAAALVEAPQAAFEAQDDGTLEGLSRKQRAYREWLAESEDARLISDVWCAAFVWPKQPGDAEHAAPVKALWEGIRKQPKSIPDATRRIARDLVEQYRFFHWHVEFREVFKRGGFDVVLGNPPWERVKLQEQEFFAPRSEEIATAPNAAARKRLIAKLPDTNPDLWREWCDASREAEGQSFFVRQSGRYPLCGKGDVNTYALFAEHNRRVLGPTGVMGCVLPAGIATDDTTKEYFQSLVEGQSLAAVYHFENEERIFVGVNNMFRFVLLAATGAERKVAAPQVVAFARSTGALRDPERRYSLTSDEFRAINPNTRTFPTFLTRRDADLNLTLYRRAGVLWREDRPDGNRWGVRFLCMFHMAADSGLFLAGDDVVAAAPLYEAKMVHHFDHRFATYAGATQANLNKGTLPQATETQHTDPLFAVTPEYWVKTTHVTDRLKDRWTRRWLLGWRDITNAHNERTVIASLIPRIAVGHKLPLFLSDVTAPLLALLYANLCSFALDYAARQKVGSTSLTYFILKQLPILPPTTYASPSPWHPGVQLVDWILPRVLELTYTAWDLQPFGKDVGYDGPPFRWDPARRFLLRAELDAAFFHLYGLSRDDTDYILDTFPIVRKNDEKAHGEYRTKRVILEVYDAMAEAARTGTPYVTRLDPPPADPRVAHPPRPEPTS